MNKEASSSDYTHNGVTATCSMESSQEISGSENVCARMAFDCLEENLLVVPVQVITTTTTTTRTRTRTDTRTISRWKIILYGQAIALCLATCSISSAALQNIDGIRNMPLFQLSSVYLSLVVHLMFLERPKGKDNENDNDNEKDSDNDNERQCRNGDKMATEETFLIKDDIKDATKSINGDESTTLTRTRKRTRIHSCSHAKYWCWRKIRLHSPWYFYALLAFLDVQANFFVVLSFRHTAVVNSTILTSLSILSVITTSKIILGRVFNKRHFAGALSCILGASCIVTLDSQFSNEPVLGDAHVDVDVDTLRHDMMNTSTEPNSRLLGDAFAIAAALLFGLNDTLAEYSVQNSTPNEYLGMLGLFGFIFSLCQSLIFENRQVTEFMGLLISHCQWFFSGPIISDRDGDGADYEYEYTYNKDSIDMDIDLVSICSIWAGYIITFYIFYVSASHFLIVSDATMMSLSLQTVNVWTGLYSIFFQKLVLSPLFFCSVGLILFGVWLYERGPPSSIK